MQVFDDWDDFCAALDRVLPRFSEEPLLAIAEGQKPFVEA
jgi:hypothetical protein